MKIYEILSWFKKDRRRVLRPMPVKRDNGADEQPQENIISRDSSIFLDFVRFLAAEFVVLGHLFWFIDAKFNEVNAVTKYPAFLFLAHIGVILFFILSGMLISNSVFRKMKSKDYNFKIYFIDRFARIYSGHIIHLITILILSLIHIKINLLHYIKFFGGLKSLTIVGFLGNFFMLQEVYPFDLINYYLKLLALPTLNISIPTFGNAFILWTLAIEWWTYLFFGWLVLGLKKYSIFDFRYILPLLFFSILPIKFLVFLGNNLVEMWFLGVFVTLVLYAGRSVSISTPFSKKVLYLEAIFLLIVLSILRLAHLLRTNTDLYAGDIILPILISILFTFVILFLNENKKPISSNISKAFKFMAGYSYTLYGTHFPIIALIYAFNLPISKFVLVPIAFLLANLLAILIAYRTEMRHKTFRFWIKKRLGLIKEEMLNDNP